jgi:hypothetical protein
MPGNLNTEKAVRCTISIGKVTNLRFATVYSPPEIALKTYFWIIPLFGGKIIPDVIKGKGKTYRAVTAVVDIHFHMPG